MTARMALTASQARELRMSSLLLDSSSGGPSTVAGIVEWFGAMQAQDEGSVLWSLGLRLPGSSPASLQRQFEEHAVVRTWPMRGTIHLVPARDAHWMLDLMAGGVLAGSRTRRLQLELSDETAERGAEVLAAALSGGRGLTRAQCLATLVESGIPVDGQRGYHLLGYASQRGVTAMTPRVDGVQVFVLLDEWVPEPVRLDRQEALATIARRYFRSHGPASLKDFVGWTGLTTTDARQGIAEAGQTLAEMEVDGQLMWAAADALDRGDPAPGDDHVLALPGFDEYLLGYKGRELMIEPGHLQAIVPGSNGMFRPTFVRGGQVIGTWTRKLGKAKAVVDARPLRRMGTSDRRAVEQSLEPFGAFHGVPVEVRWPD